MYKTCNKCGTLKDEKEIVAIKHKWGYFSNKDGELHSFNLCEECYDKIIKELLIPVKVEQYTEFL